MRKVVWFIFSLLHGSLLLASEEFQTDAGEKSYFFEEETDSSFFDDSYSELPSQDPPVVERAPSQPLKKTRPSEFTWVACTGGSRANQIIARHSQGAGVGYIHGYTTLEGFFAPSRSFEEWNPFLDLRGHIFNNSTFAANGGIGVRYVGSSLAWGINGYYDYRNTSRLNFNQVGAGLEVIGSFWSVRLNGYLPVGAKKSALFDPALRGAASGPSFAFFEGHHLFITLSGTQELVAKREFALKGLDANFSVRALKKGFFALDFGAGPYYFQGAYDKVAAGAKASITARFSDYASLSITGTCDSLFHQRVQGAFSLSIPFGAKSFRKTKSSSSSDCVPSFYDLQLARGAERSEIVVLDTHHKRLAAAADGDTVVAIDPDTGQPYEIYFVNNLSHSDGTFESPFPTLPEALVVAQPNNIIYVYQGDGTPYDTPVALLDKQMLLGSGTVQYVNTQAGVIAIPAQTAGSPTLENSVGSPVITLANGNTVSGFIIDILNPVDVVAGSNIQGTNFLNNSVVSLITTGTNNLHFTDCTGTLLVQNNQFTMDPADAGSFGIFLTDAGSAASNLICANNTFTNHATRGVSLSYSGSSSPIVQIGNGNSFVAPAGVSGTNAIDVFTSGSTNLVGAISGLNVFSGYTSDVIHLDFSGTSSEIFAIVGNMLNSDPTAVGTRGISYNDNSSGGSAIAILNNHCQDQYNAGISCFAGTNANVNLAIIGNTVDGLSVTGSNGIQINGSDFAEIQTNVENNQLTNHENQGISLFVNSSATIQAAIQSNTVTAPDGISGTVGIELGASNTSAVSSSYFVANNVCSNHSNANIQAFPNNLSIVSYEISGNICNAPASPPLGSNPQGIQIGSSNTAVIAASITGQNQCLGHTDHGINVFSSDDSQMTALIDNNLLIASTTGDNSVGINVGCNTSATPIQHYSVTRNTCSGHTNGNIQCFPNQFGQVQINVSDNILSSAVNGSAGHNPSGIQIAGNNNSHFLDITISGNTWTGPLTYQPSSSPEGIQVGCSDSAVADNITISGNTVTYTNTVLVTNTSLNGIQVNINNDSIVSAVTIEGNAVAFNTSSYVSDSGASGISLSAQNQGFFADGVISGNIISAPPLSSPVSNMQMQFIGVGVNDNASAGSSLSPIIVENNTLKRIEGNGITLLNSSVNDFYVNVLNNSVSLGTANLGEIGIVTVPFGTGALVSTISGNTIAGNKGGFIGIAVTNQGTGCQDVTVQNNTIKNVHGFNPMIPIPGVGGGIVAAILNSGNLNVLLDNNALSGNTPQGILELDAGAFGATGNLCVSFENNHGIPGSSPDGYTISNPTSAPASTIKYYDNLNNAGTFTFLPSPGDVTQIFAPCTSCP